MKVGLGNFGMLWSQVVERAERFTRLHLQVGLACSSLFLYSFVLEVWLMLSKIVDHMGREYGCEM